MNELNRVFLGVRAPQGLAQTIEGVQTLYKRKLMGEQMRWDHPATMALTLVSLGDLSVGTIQGIPTMVEGVVARFPKMNFVFEGLTGLPNPVQPRHLELTMRGDVEQLTQLQKLLTGAVVPITGVVETRPFVPTIPIGRLSKESEASRVNLGRAPRTNPVGELGAFPIESVELLQAAVGDMGIKLQPIYSFPLS